MYWEPVITEELGLTKQEIMTLVLNEYVYLNENRSNQILVFVREENEG